MNSEIRLSVRKASAINQELYNWIASFVKNQPNKDVILNIDNTCGLTPEIVKRLENIDSRRIKIRIVGGYDEVRVAKYTAEHYVLMHRNDNVYSLDEIRRIMRVIVKIEAGINPAWSTEQKLIYFIGYLNDKIIYHPFHETQPSKDIRSLRGLYSGKTVCAGYALILKELCDRNDIECQYVEGVCSKEDAAKDVLTHAWNIVKLNGEYFPIDLTWRASKNKRGKALSFEDLANVNEFIKSHIPGKYEVIQDYAHTLKSIDGMYLATIDSIINRNKTYESTRFFGRRKDGSEYTITQVSEMVIENVLVYRYIYTPYENDKMGNPIVFYSTANVANMLMASQRKKKLEMQLREAKQKGNYKKAQDLEKMLEGSEFIEPSLTAVDDLLFSKANLQRAIDDKTHFIGGLDLDRGKKTTLKGIVVDPVFAKKINKKSSTYYRSDGTSFVVEEWGKIELSTGFVYRYSLYEPILVDGEWIIKKDTIFTDEDIMHDYRMGLSDIFLSRSRIDRKEKEAGGYLGRFSQDEIKIYDRGRTEFFKSGIYRYYEMSDKQVKDYVETLTFDDMKRLVRNYSITYVNGKPEVCSKSSGRIVKDKVLSLQAMFANIWLDAAGTKFMGNEPVPGYTYAFNSSCEELFKAISDFITDSMNRFGTVDTYEVLRMVEEKYDNYKYASEIVTKLFASEFAIKTINELYRLQNPSSLWRNKKLEVLGYNEETFKELARRKRVLEEQKKKLLEVVEENNRVVIRPRK